MRLRLAFLCLLYTAWPLAAQSGSVSINGFAFSPRGDRLAAATSDGVRVWSPDATQIVLRPGEFGAEMVWWSGNGRWLVSLSDGATIVLWDAQTGQEKARHRMIDNARVTRLGAAPVALSGDGQGLAYARDGKIQVLTLEGLRLARSFQAGAAADVYGAKLLFTRDSRAIILGNSSDGFALYDAASGKLLRRGALSVDPCLLPDGARFIGNKDSHFGIFDLASGQAVKLFTEYASGGCDALSPDGLVFASAPPFDDAINLYDAQTGRLLRTLKGGAGVLAFTPNGQFIAANRRDDANLYFWNARTGALVATLTALPNHKWQARSSAGQGKDAATLAALLRPIAAPPLAAAAPTPTPEKPAAAAPELFAPQSHRGAIKALAYSADGKLLASGGGDVSGDDNTVKIYDVRANTELRTLTGHTGNINGVAFVPDNQTVISGSADRSIVFWSVLTGEKLRTLYAGEPVVSMALNRDGRWLVAAVGNEYSDELADPPPYRVKLWDARSGELRQDLTGHTIFLSSVAVSPDGGRIASGDYGGVIKMWDATTGRALYTIKADASAVMSLAFSPDGKLLASGCQEAAVKDRPTDAPAVKLWDVATGAKRKALPVTAQSEIALAFSPDGQRLAVGRFSDTSLLGAGRGANFVQLWDVATGRETATFEPNQAQSLAFAPNGKTLAAAAYKEVQIFNTTSGRVARTLAGRAEVVNTLTFSPDGKRLLADGGAKIIDIRRAARVIPSFAANTDTVFSPDGEMALRPTPDTTAETTDAITVADGKLLYTIPDFFTSAAFSPDGRRFVISGETEIKVFEAANGQPLAAWPNTGAIHLKSSAQGNYLLVGRFQATTKSSTTEIYDVRAKKLLYATKDIDITRATLSPDEKLLAMDDLRLFDLHNGRKLRALDAQAVGIVSEIAFSPDSRLIAAGGDALRLWNAESGAEVATLTGHAGRVNAIAFAPDGQTLASAGEDRTVKLWDTSNSTLRRTLTAHTGSLTGLAFAPDGKRLASAAGDARTILWNVADGAQVISFIHTDAGSVVALTPDNYYLAPRPALAAIAFRAGGKVVPAEQFDLKYNRPDIVLERLGYAAPELINLYRNAYQRRLQRLNVAPEQLVAASLELPEIALTNPDLPASTDAPTLALEVRATDAQANLARLDVLVNDVPAFGANGLDLHPQAARQVAQKLNLELGRGRNRVEISATNERGVESLREVVEVEYAPKTDAKPDLYVLAVGVSRYAAPENNLEYAAKDAGDLTEALERNNRADFAHIYTRRLLNKEATRQNILAAKKFLAQAQVDDRVIVFVSGHGLLDARREYYFATADTDFTKPAERGLRYEELESLLDALRSRRKLLLIDTCHAGEADKQAVAGNANPAPKPVVINDGAEKVVRYKSDLFGGDASQSGFDNVTAILNETFADLRRGTGATVIAAAGAAEYALESERWRNGVFTYSLLRGLEDGAADADRDGALTLNEMQQFVAAEVTRLTNGLQKPVARREPTAAEFSLAHKQDLLLTLRHQGAVFAVALSPNGKTLASGGENDIVRLWNAATGQQSRLISSVGFAYQIRWRKDGGSFTAVWYGGAFITFDLQTGRNIKSFAAAGDAPTSFAFSPDERFIAANDTPKAVTMYDTQKGALVRTLTGHQDYVRDVAWSDDGKLIASAGADKIVRLWDAADGKPLRLFTGHRAAVQQVAFYRTAEGRLHVVSASKDGALIFWNPADGAVVQNTTTPRGVADSVTVLAVSLDGRCLATGHQDGSLRLWRTADQKLLEVIYAHAAPINAVSFGANNQIVATGSGDQTAKLWRCRCPPPQ
jgi:WD40 repeat protein